MKFFRGVFFFLLLGALANAAWGKSPGPAAVFQEANAAYREGNYAKAGSLYESLIARGWRRADVFYNLGNTYFKAGRIGLAILNYEKAKRLDPRDRDTRANLAYVRGLLEYRVEDRRNWYLKVFDAMLASFTQKEIGIVSLGVGLLFWMGWAFGLYFQQGSSWGGRLKALLFVTLLCAGLWILKGAHDATVREAIALKAQAAVRYGPSHKDQVAFRLGEGIKVRVKKRIEDWSQVVLTNGETGWMYQEEIGVI